MYKMTLGSRIRWWLYDKLQDSREIVLEDTAANSDVAVTQCQTPPFEVSWQRQYFLAKQYNTSAHRALAEYRIARCYKWVSVVLLSLLFLVSIKAFS